MCDRIVALVDMDCFYCQVELRLNPTLKGKPMAVVQYNQWQGGGIIAVNYEARQFGVTRHIRGNEAKQKCQDIVLVPVPAVRGKADLTKYREAGREVVNVLCQFSDCVEKASVDEAYLDLTQAVEKRMQTMNETAVTPSQLANTFVVGFGSVDSNDEGHRSEGMLSWLENVYQTDFRDEALERLTVAGVIVEEMRAAVYEQTGFRCSAGIAHNKILGKLACGLHKPNRQTILSHAGVADLYRTLPIKKVRSLGGKFGDTVMEVLGCNVMADLARFTEAQLQQHFDEKSGTWLYNIARGIDTEPVTPRLMSKSIGCCKKFPGKQALSSKTAVEKWLFDLATEVSIRILKELEENKRRATLLTVSYQQSIDSRTVSSSRCGPLSSYEPQEMANEALELIKKSNTAPENQNYWSPPLKYLGISVSKFEDKSLKQTSTIHNFFKTATKSEHVEEINSENKSNTVEEKIDIRNDNVHQINHNDVKSSKGTIEGEPLDENSFFFRYFKQRKEALLLKQNIAVARSDVQSSINETFEANRMMLQAPSPPKENNIQSDLKVPTKKKISESRSSQEPSTSGLRNQILDDSNSNENWISLREIFPDINEVDDNVLALLPSPMQNKMLSRIQERNSAAHISDESRHSLKNQQNFNKEETNTSLVSEEHKVLREPTEVNCVNTSHKNKSYSSKNKFGYDHQNESDIEDTPEEVYDPVLKNNIEIKADVTMDNQGYINRNKCKEIDVKKHALENNNCHPVNLSNPHAKRNIFNEHQRKNGNIAYDKIEVAIDTVSDVSRSSCVLPVITNEHSEDSSLVKGVQTNGQSATFKDKIPTRDEVYKEVCPHCKELISLIEYPEHLDFHVATELDKQLNCNTTVVNVKTSALKSSLKDVMGKRKRGKPGKSKQSVGKDKKLRSITAFFTPMN